MRYKEGHMRNNAYPDRSNKSYKLAKNSHYPRFYTHTEDNICRRYGVSLGIQWVMAGGFGFNSDQSRKGCAGNSMLMPLNTFPLNYIPICLLFSVHIFTASDFYRTNIIAPNMIWVGAVNTNGFKISDFKFI